jgi:hypothetical protein
MSCRGNSHEILQCDIAYLPYKCQVTKISTTTKIITSESVWHLLAFYMNYMVKKHWEEILFSFKVVVESFYMLLSRERRAIVRA